MITTSNILCVNTILNMMALMLIIFFYNLDVPISHSSILSILWLWVMPCLARSSQMGGFILKEFWCTYRISWAISSGFVSILLWESLRHSSGVLADGFKISFMKF